MLDKTYAETLASAGMVVTTVESGDEAQLAVLEAAQQEQPFSFLVVDAETEIGSTCTLLSRLCATIDGDHCGVAVLVPVALMEHARQLQEWGADRVLMKPVMPDELLACARQLQPEACESSQQRLDFDLTPDQQPNLESPLTPNRQSLKVLVVDDSPVNQDVACGLLEFMGYSVDVADNGREAVDAVSTGRFDVVLMDIEMPEMDGFEATSVIRQQESKAKRHIPVIAMSAHIAESIEEMGREAGMDHFVSKPINPDEIQDVLENLPLFISPRTDEHQPR